MKYKYVAISDPAHPNFLDIIGIVYEGQYDQLPSGLQAVNIEYDEDASPILDLIKSPALSARYKTNETFDAVIEI